MAEILVVDDETNLLYSFELFLSRKGHHVTSAESYAAAAELLENESFDLVITDILLKGDSGLSVLETVGRLGLKTPVVMMTGQPSIDTASEAVRLGAFEYLRKPVVRDMLYQVTDRALAYKKLLDGKEALERENSEIRARLESIFQSVPTGVVTIEPGMEVTEANRAAKRMLGQEETRLPGLLKVFFSAGLRRGLLKIVQSSMEGETGFAERRIECGSACGESRIMAVGAEPLINGKGAFSGLVMAMRDITREERLEERLLASRRYQGMVGDSPAMGEVYGLIDDLLDTDTTVLVTGESGTGKELVGEALHMGGPRRSGPLVKVNCSALSESILESELFGHVRGAFTGAVSDREGRFQMAEGGTIFLDEIGDTSQSVQLKLLRVLQDKEFERVGDGRTFKADVRVIAATNRNLRDLVEKGVFRQDLYYRLKVVEIELPPLRRRGSDIVLLADHFRTIFNRKLGKSIGGFSQEALERLRSHSWPGNVRELQHAVEHACVRCREETLTVGHLPPELQALSPDTEPENRDVSLAEAMRICKGNKSKAARMLGVSRPTLYRRLKNAGLSD